MKSNDFINLCDIVYSKEVSVTFFVKFVASVLFQRWKQK